jgi:hypothetical protein
MTIIYIKEPGHLIEFSDWATDWTGRGDRDSIPGRDKTRPQRSDPL